MRLIAGDLGGHSGPGVTHTPITYAHVTLPPGGQLVVPWNPAFNAMAYSLLGQGYAGPDDRPKTRRRAAPVRINRVSARVIPT